MRSGDRLVLEAFVEAFAEDAGRTSYAELALRQQSPFGTLGHGAAGVAYALRRAGLALGQPAWGKLAAAWIAPAVTASRLGPTLRSPGSAVRPARASLFFGLGGLHFADAMTARSPGRRRRAVARFQQAVRAPGSADLYRGAAGVLMGAARLGLPTLAEQMARRLGRRRRRPRLVWGDPSGWLAHGQPGVYLALLAASRRELETPDWLDGALASLAAEYLDLLRATTGRPPLRGSVCKGSAGMALLFAAAWERRRQDLYLEAARAAAADVEAGPVDGPSLCCGAGGGAYALLALRRIDGESWRARAARRARAALSMRDAWLPYGGVLGGQAGLFCLAADLLADEPGGFPVLEA